MKKKIIYGLLLLVLLVGGFIAWKIFGPAVTAPQHKYFYIKAGSNYAMVKEALVNEQIISSTFFFDRLASQTKYTQNVKAGRYEIKDGMSLYNLVKMLRAGKQSPVNLVITKLRTPEELAAKIAANFDCDSVSFINLMNNTDSLAKYGLNRYTAMTAVIPNTYSIFWNTAASRIFKKLVSEKEKFWNEDRKKKAAALNMSPEEVYTLASIVEEETTKDEDRGKVASVYINRIHAGQRLEADPTIKFALKNFALKRIYKSHIESCAGSPYNTYFIKGLPAGPICTPSSRTIDAVLNAPATDYMFFVAKPGWSGLSNFTSSFQQHQVNARLYQHFLDSINIK